MKPIDFFKDDEFETAPLVPKDTLIEHPMYNQDTVIITFDRPGGNKVCIASYRNQYVEYTLTIGYLFENRWSKDVVLELYHAWIRRAKKDSSIKITKTDKLDKLITEKVLEEL